MGFNSGFKGLICWLVQRLFGGHSLEAVYPRWRGAGCLCSYMC